MRACLVAHEGSIDRRKGCESSHVCGLCHRIRKPRIHKEIRRCTEEGDGSGHGFDEGLGVFIIEREAVRPWRSRTVDRRAVALDNQFLAIPRDTDGCRIRTRDALVDGKLRRCIGDDLALLRIEKAQSVRAHAASRHMRFDLCSAEISIPPVRDGEHSIRFRHPRGNLENISLKISDSSSGKPFRSVDDKHIARYVLLRAIDVVAVETGLREIGRARERNRIVPNRCHCLRTFRIGAASQNRSLINAAADIDGIIFSHGIRSGALCVGVSAVNIRLVDAAAEIRHVPVCRARRGIRAISTRPAAIDKVLIRTTF